jgi:DNA-directed RNA polymerase specialized sigma24 family protein
MKEYMIPVSIFSKEKLSPFETIVMYLKEKQGLNYHEIGALLNRDERNIWTVYNRAKKKWKKY